MWKTFHCSMIGRSHLQASKVCQDFSACYGDAERSIITSCDGHGGAVYLRSERGSRFASDAAIETLKGIRKTYLNKTPTEEIEKRLRLEVLCAWNARVERDLAKAPLREAEMVGLNEEQRFFLKHNPVKAYGTTMHAAMVIGDKIVYLGIGDGGVFFLKGKELFMAKEDEDDDPVANITYSLCQEDAFKHIVAKVFDAKQVDSVLACTDGTINPYRNYENFHLSFVLPITGKLAVGQDAEVSAFMERLGREIGIGDDVSVAVLQRIKRGHKERQSKIVRSGKASKRSRGTKHDL